VSDDRKPLTDSALLYPHGYPARETKSLYLLFGCDSPPKWKSTQATLPRTYCIIFERLNARCQPLRRSQADMRKIATSLRFLSRDRGAYAPLVHGTPSRSYSTMSHTAPTPAPEPVSSGVRNDDTVFIDPPVISPRTYDEPIVTRKELWSYYRKSCSSPPFPGLQHFVIPSILQWRQRALIILLSVRIILRFRCVLVVSRVLVPSVSLLRYIPQGRESEDINAPKATP